MSALNYGKKFPTTTFRALPAINNSVLMAIPLSSERLPLHKTHVSFCNGPKRRYRMIGSTGNKSISDEFIKEVRRRAILGYRFEDIREWALYYNAKFDNPADLRKIMDGTKFSNITDNVNVDITYYPVPE